MIQSGFEHYQKRFHANDYDLNVMAKLAALHGDRDAAKDYFSQSSGSWNYVSDGAWDSKETRQSFLDWANSEPNQQDENLLEKIVQHNFSGFYTLFETIKDLKQELFDKDVYGNTLLHKLAEINAPDYLDRLSMLGVNLEAYNSDGHTPLQTAAYYGHAENVRILINNGANVMATTSFSKNTAAHIAANHGFVDVLKIFLKSHPELNTTPGHNGTNLLHAAANKGHIKAVKYLAGINDAPLNRQDDYKYTPLHYAVWRGHEDIVRYLVEQGANPDIRNNKGHTALSRAREKGFDRIVEYLESKGAQDAEVTDNSEAIRKAKAIYQEAKPFYNVTHYPRAKEKYLQALEYYPGYALAYTALGMLAFDFEKEYEQADRYFDKAIALDPRYLDSYYWKGRANYELKRPDVYGPLFRHYVKYAPDTYNSQDLVKNWSHLLDEGVTMDENMSLLERLSEIRRLYMPWIIGSIVILLAVLLLIRFRRSRADP